MFQNSVLNKYLKTQNEKKIDEMYSQFTSYFHNAEIQENIKNSKEEQFQEGFLRELFVRILGYTLNPEPNFNLTTELKNEKGAKKTDGAILKWQQGGSHPCVIAVIELKGTDTKDLDKVNEQAFNYKNNHTDCVYVITSNFEKLRFFIHNAVAHIEFNLFTLTKEEFKIFWLCLNAENLLDGVPEKVKQESTIVEENVTKQLYKDYSTFKHELWQNLCKNRPDLDKLLLFKKTQKLLDRFLFIFFAEDSGLLPPNSISRMVERYKQLIELDAYKPLYEIFKQYFGYINKGRKGKTAQDDIFAYNGGLFQPDELLDSKGAYPLVEKNKRPLVDDDVLKPHVLTMTAYDFQTDVDVNILGHIFENSLNEIENVTAQLSATAETTRGHVPLSIPQVSKRKKDGVFYTPKYITKYIVENTVGKLCEEKKAKLNIVDEEYAKGRKNRKKATVQALYDNLQTYRNWLLEITICDPACGSGAFLNQALEFLINEHAYIDELQANLLEASMILQDVSNHVLEKNIFGVDINDESVEIAKLSLWLRTAQRGRKLTSLNNNIKCGNSLIDDPEVAGEKAFNWQKEFPQVFTEKEKTIWHITTATHNSRYSQRMFDNHVKLGEAIWLDEEDEIIITKTILEIVKKDNLNVLAYNICGDHIHILLVCEKEEMPKIVGKIKAMTSRARNIAKGYTVATTNATDTTTTTREHAPLSLPDEKRDTSLSLPDEKRDTSLSPPDEKRKRGETQTKLWTQKYGKTKIENDEYLYNAINYIRNNRKKHELPPINTAACPLVEEMCCTYEHAFRTEYKGGFDVVIGNPPYVRPRQVLKTEKKYLSKNYDVANNQFDLYQLFIEKAFGLCQNESVISYIVPNTFLGNETSVSLRKFIIEKYNILKIIDYKQKVFFDASVDVLTFVFTKKEKNTLSDYFTYENNNLVFKHNFNQQSFISNVNYNFTLTLDNTETNIFEKIKTLSENISSFFNITTGIKEYQTGKGKPPQNKSDRDLSIFNANYKKDETFLPEIRGKNLHRYMLDWKGEYISYGIWLAEPRNPEFFKGEKLLIRKIPSKNNLVLSYISEDFVVDQSIYIAKAKENSMIYYKYALSVLSSKLILWFFRHQFNEFDDLFPQIKTKEFASLPIRKISKEAQHPLIEKADQMLSLNKALQTEKNNFLDTLQEELFSTRGHVPLTMKITKKLDAFYELEYDDFKKELRKKKIKISLGNENNEWRKYFNTTKQKINELQNQINQTDKEIDKMVYELYELTAEEIEIVENSTK